LKNSFLALPKVVRQPFVGEVGTFLFFWCQVFSGCCLPTIIKIGCFIKVFYSKNKEGERFWDTRKHDPFRIQRFGLLATVSTV